jgi:hypothetical protein
MPSHAPKPHINTFYLLWFTWFDPIVIFLTVISCIATPSAIVEMAVPPSISAYDPMQAPLMWQIAPLFGFMGIMFGVLLRASQDPKVWRIVQAATLAVDISLIVILLGALEMQGRMWVFGEWRGIERFNLGFTVAIALGRIAFLMGIGEGNVSNKKVRIN